LLFLALLSPCAALAQMPYLQIVQSQQVSANAASVACPAFLRTTTVGNYLVISSAWFGTNNLPSVSDTAGHTFTNKYTDVVNASTVKLGLSTTTITSASADAVTVAVTSGSFMSVVCMEVLPNFSLTLDGTQPAANAFSGTPSTATSASITTTFNNDFAFCIASGFNSAGLFWESSPYKLAGEANGADSGAMSFAWTGTVGAKTCTFNQKNNSSGAIAIVAFQPLTGSTITIQSPTALPDAATSVAYQYTELSTGGTAALTWSISVGALPTGLSINSSTGAITGTPTVSNNYSFTIQATDGTHTSTKASTMAVTTGFNTPTVVQSKSDGSNSNSTTLTFTSNVTAGDTIVVIGGKGTTHTLGQYCTDSVATPFQLLESADGPADHLASEMITQQYFVGVVPSSGADTVTCSSLGGVSAIYEVSNVQLFGSENVSVQARSNSGSPITSTSLTTIVPNEILFTSASFWTTTTSATLSAPFTGVNATFNNPSGYDAVTTVTGYTSSFTFSGNTDTGWMIPLVGIRPGSNGIVTPPSTGRHKGQIL
jgi:hypothetical protein